MANGENYDKNLVSRVSGLERDVKNLVSSVDRIVESVENLSKQVSQGTNWGVLGTWSAVIITIIGGIGYLAVTPMATALLETRLDVKEHIKLEGHPTAMTRVEALEVLIDLKHELLLEKIKNLKEKVDVSRKPL